MSDQEIESKLKKLEQMMNDDGASEGEKSNALLLFEKLVKNYNVDISKRKESSIFEYKSTIAFTPEAFNGVYHSIATYYAKYFNIYCILQRTDDGKLKYFRYIGKDDDVLMCDYMITHTVRQFQRMFKFKLFSKNKDGILGEFFVTLRNIIDKKIQERDEYLKTGQQGEGLILVRKNEVVKFKDFYVEKYGPVGHASYNTTTNGAKGVGASLANGINFNRPLNGSSKQTHQLN